VTGSSADACSRWLTTWKKSNNALFLWYITVRMREACCVTSTSSTVRLHRTRHITSSLNLYDALLPFTSYNSDQTSKLDKPTLALIRPTGILAPHRRQPKTGPLPYDLPLAS
jgi:hypothetical protein